MEDFIFRRLKLIFNIILSFSTFLITLKFYIYTTQYQLINLPFNFFPYQCMTMEVFSGGFKGGLWGLYECIVKIPINQVLYKHV
jgi:hypothetical protein